MKCLTESAHWTDSVSKLWRPLVVRLCFTVDCRLLVEEHIANIDIPFDIFGFLPFQWFFAFEIVFQVFDLCKPAYCAYWVSLQGEGLCLWLLVLVTGDRWHAHDTWHIICWSLSVCFCQFWYGVTICTHQEIQCLLYVYRFSWNCVKDFSSEI